MKRLIIAASIATACALPLVSCKKESSDKHMNDRSNQGRTDQPYGLRGDEGDIYRNTNNRDMNANPRSDDSSNEYNRAPTENR